MMKSLLVALVVALGAVVSAAESPRERLRVGFYALPGYHDHDSEGALSGYEYELLQLLRPYGGWDYDYVGSDESRAEALSRLAKGEIDICGGIVKTDAREGDFDFVATPIGRMWMELSARRVNAVYRANEYAAWSGIRIGMLNENGKNAALAPFAAANGFSYIAKGYDRAQDLDRALICGEVDAILAGSLRRRSLHEIELAAFDFQPFHFAVRKGNVGLRDRLNHALQALLRDQPQLLQQLQSKYYPDAVPPAPSGLLSTSDWLAFAGIPLRVAVHDGNPPLCDTSSGEPSGVAVDFVRLLREKSGLDFQLEVLPCCREELALEGASRPAVIADFPYADLRDAERRGYTLNFPFVALPVSLVRPQLSIGHIQCLAVLEDCCGLADIGRFFPGVTVRRFKTSEALADALNLREVDGALMLSSEATRFAESTGSCAVAPIDGLTADFSIAVSTDMPQSFGELLLRLQGSVLPSEMDEILSRHAIPRVKVFSLQAWMLRHALGLSAAAIVQSLLLVAFGFVVWRQRRLTREIVSERDRAVTAEQAKGVFFADVSHDIRTPLNAIIGFSDLLVREEMDANRRREYLDKIVFSANALMEVVDSGFGLAGEKVPDGHKASTPSKIPGGVGGLSLLLVDDSPLNLKMLSAYCTRLGVAKVVAVTSAEVALERLSNGHYDAVLTDVRMPVMDGAEFARRIRANPVWRSLPVYAVTANVDVRMSEDSPFTDVLYKPVRFDTLKSLLEGLTAV